VIDKRLATRSFVCRNKGTRNDDDDGLMKKTKPKGKGNLSLGRKFSVWIAEGKQMHTFTGVSETSAGGKQGGGEGRLRD
jgi:hypothetical protein